jgi:MFS family permease
MLGSVLQPFFGKYSDGRGRKPMILLVLFGASFFALFAGLGSSLYWAILGLLPAVAMLTAVRPVILAAAVEYSGKSEATTLGIVFTVLDGVGMFGALLAGMAGEFELRYAFIMAAGMAFLAAIICVFLNFKISDISRDQPIIATVSNPADP